MIAQEIVDFVFEIAPNPTWGKENFFEFGDGSFEVTGIGVAWWITSDILQDLISRGYELGLTHERVVYDLVDHYQWGRIIKTDELEVNQRFAKLAREHHVAIHRFHSNIDIADWGMPHALLDQLGWSNYPADWSRGIPVVTIPPMSLADLIKLVKAKLQLPFMRYDGDLQCVVRRVFVGWGGICFSWNGVACGAPLGFDVIMGGDITDGVVRLAREHNWCVIDAQHHVTEREAMKVLADRVRERFPKLQVHFFENTLPWSVA
jgi:putative NIF3 family GTP cyclohydrolase 1 type 2